MSTNRTLTAEQVRMVQAAGLPVEAVQLGWNGAKGYGEDFRTFLTDLAKRLKVRARA